MSKHQQNGAIGGSVYVDTNGVASSSRVVAFTCADVVRALVEWLYKLILRNGGVSAVSVAAGTAVVAVVGFFVSREAPVGWLFGSVVFSAAGTVLTLVRYFALVFKLVGIFGSPLDDMGASQHWRFFTALLMALPYWGGQGPVDGSTMFDVELVRYIYSASVTYWGVKREGWVEVALRFVGLLWLVRSWFYRISGWLATVLLTLILAIFVACHWRFAVPGAPLSMPPTISDPGRVFTDAYVAAGVLGPRAGYVPRSEFGDYLVPLAVSVRLDKEVWEVTLDDAVATYKIKHLAYLGDRAQKVALGAVTVPSASSGAEMSSVEQVYLADSNFAAYVQRNMQDWWERKPYSYHGKVAATRFEAAWGVLWQHLVRDEANYGAYCEAFGWWLDEERKRRSGNSTEW